MLDGAGAESLPRSGKRHKVVKHIVQPQYHMQSVQHSGSQSSQHSTQPPGGWPSDDSASDSGSSDGDGGARSKYDNESDEDDIHWPLPYNSTSTSLWYLRNQLLITVLRYSRLDIALTVKYVIIHCDYQGYVEPSWRALVCTHRYYHFYLIDKRKIV